ncbi:response regulator transcription factor [Dysgonomonas sp. 511]|uniref:response regulator transcription factor n=1 Tax=Dysgonomonas sp. 511 TaxID=2302930 RepID=UPI0013CFCF34|nr:response regulator transcription factor [Dysgonomonas sp. 511]NDV77753.1 DNA-binding response regulator [Dysgonomonas sp. 511]
MKIKVLLVEDEPALSMIIKDTLEKRDFEVECAANGNEGLELFHKTNPDIVVADIMMPKLDGFSMTQLIRQSDKVTPILFLSAKSKTDDVVQGFEIGGNDYLKKPFGMEELIVRIKALLNRVNTEKPKNKIYEIGAYTFDPLMQKLSHSQKVEILSHRESAILECLCSNQNNIVENKAILLELWGDDSFFNTRSLHVFMVKLRKKLSLDNRVQIINIRGVGYKMIF